MRRPSLRTAPKIPAKWSKNRLPLDQKLGFGEAYRLYLAPQRAVFDQARCRAQVGRLLDGEFHNVAVGPVAIGIAGIGRCTGRGDFEQPVPEGPPAQSCIEKPAAG